MRRYLTLIILAFCCVLRIFHACSSSWEVCTDPKPQENSTSKVAHFFEQLRQNSMLSIRKYVPSPHSELLLGVTLGIDELDTVPKFNKALKDTGTVHVVV